MLMLAGTKVIWNILSDRDPRWNSSHVTVLGVGGGPPPSMVEQIDKLRDLYGEPPEDLQWSIDKVAEADWVSCGCGNIIKVPEEIKNLIDKTVSCHVCHEEIPL